MKPEFDIAIIGGGPAGSTAASYLARAGLSVVVLESEVFPRPHVGESLVPATTPVLLEIGALDKVDAENFPKKYGASWTSAESRELTRLGYGGLSHEWSADVQFVERNQPGVDRAYTFHVDRARFDALLLSHAEEQGATVRHGVRVLEVDFEDPGTTRLACRSKDGSSTLTARMVVDASGRQTMLGRQLRTKVADPVFDQYAIHTWFEGLDRKALAGDARQAENIFIHFLPLRDTWVWQIPITDTITSIGIVTQKEQFATANSGREEFFWEFIGSRPELLEALRNSRRIRPFKAEGDYSYSVKNIVGDRYVLIGDAARFVDPIFSSGVSVALNSARIACQDIIAASAAGDFSRERFATYEMKLKRAVRHWYDFIAMYYRLNVLFTVFIQDPRYRIDVLKLLQGDVYDDEEPRALRDMREVLAAVESDPGHPWHPYLGTLRAPISELAPVGAVSG